MSNGTNFFGPVGATIQTSLSDELGNGVLIKCTAANLPSAKAGYAKGCIAYATDTGVLYTNTGTASSSTFTAVDSSTSLTLPSAFTDSTTTTGASFDLAETSLTTGKAIKVTAATANFTTAGALFYGDMTAAIAGNGLVIVTTGAYTGTGLATLTAGAMTTGIGLSIISTTGLTTGSLIRATTSTAGILATNGAISLTATGAFTSTSAVNGGFVEVKANSTVAGTIVNIVGSALTTGIALQVSNGTSAMTTGSLARFTGSGVGTLATNGMVSITHGGIFVSTANAGILDVAATALVGAGTVAHFSSTAASQTAAEILNVTQSGATLTAYTGTIASFVGGFSGNSSTGNVIGITAVNTTAGDALKIISNALTLGAATMINLSHTTSVLGAGTSMLRITSTGIDTGTTTGTLLDLASTAALAATLVKITSASLTSGKALVFTLAGLTTGAAIDTTGIAATTQNFNMNATTGSTAAPQTNAPTGFFKIGIGGTDQWVPYYNAT